MINDNLLKGLENVAKEAEKLFKDSMKELNPEEQKFLKDQSKIFNDLRKKGDATGLIKFSERLAKYADKQNKKQ